MRDCAISLSFPLKITDAEGGNRTRTALRTNGFSYHYGFRRPERKFAIFDLRLKEGLSALKQTILIQSKIANTIGLWSGRCLLRAARSRVV